jgi:hypothetical protein
LKGTPAELRNEALVMTAEVLAYNGPPHVRAMSITSDDEAIMVIAQFVPTAPLQEPVPQPVRDAFKEIAIALQQPWTGLTASQSKHWLKRRRGSARWSAQR